MRFRAVSTWEPARSCLRHGLRRALAGGIVMAAAWIARADGAVLLGSNASVPAQRAFPVAEPGGALVKAGSGFVAFGSFPSLSDADIRSALDSTAAFSTLVADFRPLGQAHAYGLGRAGIDGVFNASTSGSIGLGSPLAGHSIFVFGGTEHGVFVFKSSQHFQPDDRPLNESTVNLWGHSDTDLASGLLLGSLGAAAELPRLNGPQTTLALQGSATGELLDISLMLDLIEVVPPPPPPPAEAPVASETPPEITSPPKPEAPDAAPPSGRDPEVVADAPPEFPKLPPPVSVQRPIMDYFHASFPIVAIGTDQTFAVDETFAVTLSTQSFHSRAFAFGEIPEPAAAALVAAALLLAVRRRIRPCGS